MIKEKAEALKRALILSDGIIVSTCFFLSFFIRQRFQEIVKIDKIPGIGSLRESPSSMSSYLLLLFVAVPLWCFLLYFNGIYDDVRTRKIPAVVWIIIKSSFFVALGLSSFIFLSNYIFVSRLFFVVFIGTSFISILAEKIAIIYILRYLRRKGFNFERILIVGTGKRADTLIRKINSRPDWGLKIVGILDDEPGRGVDWVDGRHITGNIDQLSEIIKVKAVDDVIFVVPRLRLNSIEKAVLVCETAGIKAWVAMDLFNMHIAKAKHVDLDGQPFVSFDTIVMNESQLLIKRAIDIIVSGLGLLVIGPFLLVIASFVKVSSRGPALFKQQRAGLNGRKFVLYKFRTMYDGAENAKAELDALNEMDGPVFKIKRDPRVTPLGRILRKFSIDEFPQLYNVLVGHMSLIGPRALPLYEVDKFDLWQRRRMSMRPGITCLWQVNGRNKLGFNEWMKLDLYYLDNWSIYLDAEIIARTIPAVVFGSGAY